VNWKTSWSARGDIRGLLPFSPCGSRDERSSLLGGALWSALALLSAPDEGFLSAETGPSPSSFRGAFIAPWDWRHRNKETVILGAATVPLDAQAILLGTVSAAGAPDPGCVMKGNVNRKAERIYHLPGQLNYSKTSMKKGLAERWFCTEAEAEETGWRKADR
jgi:hypothetical protein